MFNTEQNNLFSPNQSLPLNIYRETEIAIPELNRISISDMERLPQITSVNLDTMFLEQEISDKNVKILVSALGTLANNYSPEELHLLATKIEFLVESWLDEYEKNIFNGKTLKELLHEGSKI